MVLDVQGRKTALLLAGAGLVYFLPLISADLFYYDDFFRNQLGYIGWIGDGRPVGNLMYSVASFGGAIVDTYPAMLLVSLTVLAIVAGMVRDAWQIDPAKFTACSFLLIANPFFLSNLHFRYDSAFMLLSVAFAFAPYAFKKNSTASFVSGALLLVFSLSSFQASITIFIGIAGSEALVRGRNRTLFETTKVLLFRAAQVIFSVLVYRLVVLRVFESNSYAADYSQLAPMGSELIAILVENTSRSLQVLGTAFEAPPGKMLALALVACAIFPIGRAVVERGSVPLLSRHLSLLALACASAGVAAVGVHIFSSQPVFYGRVYVGFGALLFTGLIACCVCAPRWIFWSLASVIAGLCTITNIVATNASAHDLEFQRSIASRIISDLDRSGLGQIETIMFSGTAPQSPLAIRAQEAFPVAGNTVQVLFSGGYDGGRFLLMEQGFGNVAYPDRETQQTIRQQIQGADPIVANHIYRIVVIEDIPVVVF